VGVLPPTTIEQLPRWGRISIYFQQLFPLVDKSPNPLAYLKSSPNPPLRKGA